MNSNPSWPRELARALWLWLVCIHLAATAGNAASLADHFADPTPVSGRLLLTASNSLATAEPGEPSHAGLPARRTLWATWTATNTGTYSFSTSNSLDSARLWLDTVVAVYSGTALSNLQVIASNDDLDTFTLWSRVFFRAYAGETFHIAVGMVDDNVGTISLNISYAGPLMQPWVAPDLNGNEISSFNFIGKILLVDFWETTCGACVEELPYLMDFYRSFQPRGLALVGLSADPSAQIVKDYLATRPVPYVMGMKSVTADFSLSGSIGMPTKVLVDQDSRIVARYIGGISPVNQTCQFYEREIAGLLRPRPPGPRMAVAQTAGNIRLSWSATEPPQRLESSVNPASAWSAVNSTLSTNNGQIVVTVPASNVFQFFRLKRL